MVKDQVLIAIGKGGPGDPHRYMVNPRLTGGRNIEEYRQHCQQAYERFCRAIDMPPDKSKPNDSPPEAA